MGDKVKELEEQEVILDEQQKSALLNTPNTPDETTPVGTSESDNVEVKNSQLQQNVILN